MYQVVRKVKQLSSKEASTTVCYQSEVSSFDGAEALADLLATNHADNIVVPKPKQIGPGKFWFFTACNTSVTYYVEKMTLLEHEWNPMVFNLKPAQHCVHCGFVWEFHMPRPTVTCDEIINKAYPESTDV